MTEVQFDIFKEFIDEELELGNYKDIQKIIDYTTTILKAQKFSPSVEMHVITDEEFYKVIDILNESFLVFANNQNMEESIRKPLYNSFYLENISRGNLITAANDLKVYHTLGLPLDKMGLDITMIDAYEHILNNLGLSVYTSLTDFQKLELKGKTKVKKN